MPRPHTIVVGLGAVGSATAWHLAERGHRVTAFDRWIPPHANGSTHGETRVTRVTAWEGAAYVPLARRAHERWDALEAIAKHPLRERCGGLFVDAPDAEIVAGTIASARATGARFEELSAAEVQRRARGLRVPDGHVGVFDPEAGVLAPERCIEAMHAAAHAASATLRLDEQMLSWRADGAGVRVETSRGSYRADRLVLAAGAWMQREFAAIGVPLTIERQTMHWFGDSASTAADASRPVLILGDGAGHATVVFPHRDREVKAAGHGVGATVSPDTVERAISHDDIAPVHALLRDRFARDTFSHTRSAVCLYTRTPSGHFVIDRHPQHAQVLLASPCNGFGFKFASAVGEGLAALASDEAPPVDFSAWRLSR